MKDLLSGLYMPCKTPPTPCINYTVLSYAWKRWDKSVPFPKIRFPVPPGVDKDKYAKDLDQKSRQVYLSTPPPTDHYEDYDYYDWYNYEDDSYTYQDQDNIESVLILPEKEGEEGNTADQEKALSKSSRPMFLYSNNNYITCAASQMLLTLLL